MIGRLLVNFQMMDAEEAGRLSVANASTIRAGSRFEICWACGGRSRRAAETVRVGYTILDAISAADALKRARVMYAEDRASVGLDEDLAFATVTVAP